MVGLRQDLVLLRYTELAERPEIRVVAPDSCRTRDHGIATGCNPRIVAVPPTRVNNHLVANRDPMNVTAKAVNDAGGIASSDVKVIHVTKTFPLGDYIDWYASRGPNVVVVDPRRHYANQYLIRLQLRDVYLLDYEGGAGIAQAILANDLRKHATRHSTKRRFGA